jgi:hypothetical protein
MSFTSYSAQDVQTEAVPLVLASLRNVGRAKPNPIVHLLHTGTTNPKYIEAEIADADDAPSVGASSGGDFDIAREEAATVRLRKRLALHAVRGLEGVYHDDGREVTGTPAEIMEFLLAIPKFVVLQIRGWSKDPVNFQGDAPAPATPTNVEGVAKK